MPLKKRSRLNLTPVAFAILGYLGLLFLAYMAFFVYDAVTQSWDSALLYLTIFLVILRFVIFCFNRWYKPPPPRRQPLDFAKTLGSGLQPPLSAPQAAAALPPTADQSAPAKIRGLKTWPGAVVTVLILLVPVVAYFKGAIPFADLAAGPAAIPFQAFEWLLIAAGGVLCLLCFLLAVGADEDRRGPWLDHLVNLLFWWRR